MILFDFSLSYPFLQVEKQLSKQPTFITTPADIYSQFTPKRELKSILRKPSVEEKETKISSEDRIPTTQQLPTKIIKENKEKEDFNSQKVILLKSSIH